MAESCARSSRPARPPESLAESRTAELLKGVCDVDLDALDVKLPRGFGRERPAHDAHTGTMGESDLMLDTHAVARSLTAADFTPAQADALTDALRLVVEQGDHVTSDQFKVGMAEMRTEIAEVRTEIANLDSRLSTQISTTETRLTWRMLGIAGLVIAALRLLG